MNETGLLNDSDLLRRLRDHEDALVERKPESVNASDIRRTVVAFANSIGDTEPALLFIGVRDDGQIQGCLSPDKKQKAVGDVCDTQCFPPIKIQMRVLTVDGKAVVAVIIRHSKDRPHFAGQSYVRRGSESVVASREIFDEMIHARTSKVATILKQVNQLVTVVSPQHFLGRPGKVADTSYIGENECRILRCDSQIVRLQIVGSGEYVSEPLSRVEISHDEQRYRMMLIVTGAE